MDQRIWPDSDEFNEFEKKVKIKSDEALLIYDSKFSENFKNEKLEIYRQHFDKIIYIQNNKYYIGYISKMDKKGIYTTDLYCLVELNPKTGEITVVK